MITVKDLIAFLQEQPQDLPVGLCMYSEMQLLELEGINRVVACPARPDGWIHRKRPDVETIEYLIFPGN